MATAMASSNCLSSTIFSLSSKPQKHFHVHSRFSLFPKPSNSSLFLVSSPAPVSKLALIRATSEESQSFFFENSESAGESAQADDAEAVVEAYEPEAPPEGYFPSGSFDDGPPLTEDQIAEAYEEIYGPAYSGVSVLGNDIYVMDAKFKKKGAFGKIRKGKIRDGLAERVIQVRRVTKVVKGGKQLNFRAIVVVGDRRGIVGVGVAKATEVVAAVQKSAVNARRNLITVPLTKHMTFPHRADGKYGAASVMLRPACSGTGVIAGGAVRIVLEMAGVENALGKQLGSDNALNNARATVVAIQKMRHFSEVASYRGIPIEELWK